VRAGLLTLFVTAALIGCGETASPVAPTSSTAAAEFRLHASPHFQIHHTSIDSTNVTTIAERLEAQHSRITADLGVSVTPIIDVFLYPDRASFASAVSAVIGPLPSFATGAITSSTRVHILSPNLASVWQFDEAMTSTIHESAHCISLALNPGFANNPRWLWEAVAVFEAGQFVDPRTVTELRSPLTFVALNSFDTTTIYRVGYVMAEFVTVEWGRAGLVSLIQANGNLERAFQISEKVFLERWRLFLQNRYAVS
jgi:hypothetical protein